MNPEIKQTDFSAETKRTLTKRIWTSATQGERKIADIEKSDSQVIQTIIAQAIELIIELENKALATSGERFQRLHTDTDVVMILSGPGKYSSAIDAGIEKPVDTQYHDYLWTRKMDRARIRAGVLTWLGVVAKRAEKNLRDVSHEDIMQFAPVLHYAATSWEVRHFEKVVTHFAGLGLVIPSEKILTYSEVPDHGGGTRPIKNTFDQISGLCIPAETRRILIVGHGPHLIRSMYILNHFSEVVHQATVQLYPLKSPTAALATNTDPNGEIISIAKYIEMEVRGIVANFSQERGSQQPFSFET